MTVIAVGTIDAFLIVPDSMGWRVLVLQRAMDTRCPTAWETVHGHIELGEEPEDAAIREIREETGLTVLRLYNICVQPFYLHRSRTVELAVVFAAYVEHTASVVLGPEHSRAEWLTPEQALARFAWPRERSPLREIMQLLSSGDAGPVEDRRIEAPDAAPIRYSQTGWLPRPAWTACATAPGTSNARLSSQPPWAISRCALDHARAIDSGRWNR